MRALWAWLLLCIGLGTFASVSAAVGTLHVIETLPARGEELAIDEPIAFYFDRAVNCDSAIQALSITPEVAGSITCDRLLASLIFAPEQPLDSATTYTLTLSTALVGQDGAQMDAPYTLELQTTGYLRVTQVIPADGTVDVHTDSVITVLFNRPVVPLVTSVDTSSLPQPLTITPALEGEGEWLNTSTYIYHPTDLLVPGAAYTVSLSDDLQAVDGARLTNAPTWIFTTIAPQIVNINPRDGAVGLQLEVTPLMVYFNQPIDKASVEANFHLRAPDGTETHGEFEWGDDNTYFTFNHSTLLDLDTVYTVSVDADQIASESSGARLTGQTSWSFRTVPYPAIIGTTPNNGQVDTDTGGFTIFFSAPVNEDTVQDRIHISPEPESPVHYYQWAGWRVSFPALTNTTYTVTIDPGIEDPYGNRIEQGYTFSYTTAAAPPSLILNVPGGLGFYNAYNEDTAIYLTERNVPHVGLSLYNMPIDDLVTLMGRYDYSYAPDPQRLVRTWQIDTQSQQDTFVPAYVSMGDADSCPNAPDSRIHVGDSVEVAQSASPFNAYSSPFDSQPSSVIYAGFPLNVVSGPTCGGAMWWWEVQLSTVTTVWVPEGDSAAYWLNIQQQAQTSSVTVSDGDALAPGVYYLHVEDADAPDNPYLEHNHFMMVMTANVTLKTSLNQVMVWATDVNTGEPLTNASLTLYRTPRYQGPGVGSVSVIAVGATDDDGLWTVPVPSPDDTYEYYIAVLQTADHVGIGTSNMSNGIDPGMFNYRANYYPSHYQVYAYTDRMIYRPGQRVYFRAIVRQDNDLAYSLPDMATVPVQVTDSSGNVLFSQEMQLSPFGTVSGELDLSDDAPVGYYSVSINFPGSLPNQFEGTRTGFSVAEYRLPEFSVAPSAVSHQVVQDDTIRVDVASTYYFGGPVSDANVQYSVVAQPYFFRYTGEGRYSFFPDLGDDYYYYYYSYYNNTRRSEIANGTVTADAQGIGHIELPAALENNASSTFTMEATVTDESHQAVSGRTQVIVHASEMYVGVGTDRYIGLANEPMAINLIAVDWDSMGVARQSVDVEVVEERWNNVQEVDSAGHTHWTWESEEIPVMETAVLTGDDGIVSTSFTPPNGGIFIIRAHVTDSRGNTATSVQRVWVSSHEYVSWRQSNNNRIDLIADRESYQAGDTAEILITSPFQGDAHALITVERGSVIAHDVVTLDSNSYVYHLPITAAFAPDVFVSVMIVKGVDENNPVASFRMGELQLMVDTAPRQLNVSITSDVEQAAPNATVNYTVHVTDFGGNPVSAEVGVALTDLASLSLATNTQPPLLNFFYSERGLGVRTGTPLTMNTDELTQNATETIKGGGGGGGDGGVIEVRENFIDTSYWNASLVTDADGVATFSVTLPDNLTTWRLDARALTAQPDGVLLVGQATHDLISTRPLIVRPVTPRFFTLGDVVSLAAVVNNNTNESLDVDVGLQAQGVTLANDAVQTVTIAAHQRARVEWSATADNVDGVTLVFTAQSGDYQDASAPTVSQGDTLPVYRYEAPEVIGTAGMLTDAGELVEGIALPRRFEVTQGELTINLQTSLAATAIDSLDYLDHYPYGSCIESVVSAFLPNIITYRALAHLNLTNDVLRTNLETEVSYALQRLYAEQKSDGGWAWCSDDYYPSDPMTTAYALMGISEAQAYGFDIRGDVIVNARQFIFSSLIVPGLDQPNWMLNRQAFLLYALARSGMPDVARTSNLYEVRDRLTLDARAFLALTLNLIDPADTTRTDAIVSDFANAAVTSATGVHWEESYYDYWNWGSNTRSTALILMTLVKLTPDSPLLDDAVRWLITMRGVRCWSSSQETAWAVMAFTDWMEHTGELQPDYHYSVALNGDTLTQQHAIAATVRDTRTLHIQVSDLLASGLNAVTFDHGTGDGALYYSAHLRVYLPVPEIEPLSRGIVVERRYVRPGAEDTPVTEVHVGETLQVQLTIIAPNDLYYVQITDPLPAGVEAVDPHLQTSQQINTQYGVSRIDPRYGWGWWWFSNAQFHDENVILNSRYLAAGTYNYFYTIRAGLPGVYNVIPTTAEEAYFPEVYGRSDGMAFTILPAEN